MNQWVSWMYSSSLKINLCPRDSFTACNVQLKHVYRFMTQREAHCSPFFLQWSLNVMLSTLLQFVQLEFHQNTNLQSTLKHLWGPRFHIYPRAPACCLLKVKNPEHLKLLCLLCVSLGFPNQLHLISRVQLLLWPHDYFWEEGSWDTCCQ